MINDIEEFVPVLIDLTKDKKIKWEKVQSIQHSKLLGRSVPHGKVIDAYFSKKKNNYDIVVVGRIEIKIFTDVDEYYIEDDFFIVDTDVNYSEPVSYFDRDNEISGLNFGVNLSRLYRLIKLSRKRNDNKYNDWV